MRAVRSAGREWIPSGPDGDGRGVQLSEWEKDEWTYHAKGDDGPPPPRSQVFSQCLMAFSGIWLSPSQGDLPVLTMFGSTNLNSRSAHLDTELSFIMVIPSEPLTAEESQPRSVQLEYQESLMQLRRQLQSEISRIREHAVEWKGAKRKVRRLTKAIVHVVKGML